MKTVAELNTKIWYRLLKVIFIAITICSTVIVICANFDAVSHYQTDYLITCNFGNKSTFLAYKDKEIYIPLYEDYTYSLAKLPDGVKDRLRSICAISDEELKTAIRSTDKKLLYTLAETKIFTHTYLTAALWSILHLTIILLIFEVIRHIFYYIVLGSFRPTKK